MFGVAVVGKGLFGAAAARHLARSGLAPVVVGPDEPAGDDHPGPHGAHFDEARIIVARGDEAEVALTHLALSGMEELETASGRRLLSRSGALEVTAIGEGAPALVDGVVAVPGGSTRIDETSPQGYFNPRRYIAAALEDAVASGATIMADVVDEVRPNGDNFELTTRLGEKISAAAVVVAAGAWSNRLLPRPVALRLKREYVLFAELPAAAAESIRMRPTVIHGMTGRVESVYTLPPLRYPDGRWYLKLGANTRFDRAVDPDSIDHWYRRGDSDAIGDLTDAFRRVFPDLEPNAFHTERCVITYTAHGRPYIDNADRPGLYVLTGGNGHGASWADGAGAMLAGLVTGAGSALPAAPFRAVFADENPPWPGPLLLADRLR